MWRSGTTEALQPPITGSLQQGLLEANLSAPDDETTDLGAFARGLIALIGGVDLELPSRGPQRQLLDLNEATTAKVGSSEPAAAELLGNSEPVIAETIDAGPTAAKRRRR